METIPQFETERLILRAPTEQDIPAWQKYFADFGIIGHLNKNVPWPYPADGAAQFFYEKVAPVQGKDEWIWGLFLKPNPDEAIGLVHLRRNGELHGHRGFWLARKYWGRGLMTEAVARVMDYAFGELGFESMILCNAFGNTRSRRVKEKTGAIFIRVEPAEFNDPQYTQREVWELTKERWQMFRDG